MATGPLTGSNGPEPLQCDPANAGQYLCDELGKRLTSSIGYSAGLQQYEWHPTDARPGDRPVAGFCGSGRRCALHPVAPYGHQILGLRWRLRLLGSSGGRVHPPARAVAGPFRDAIRITDRFFGTQLRGFDIRGIGPRILRENYNADGTNLRRRTCVSDALGGRAYYMGRLELELPTSSSLRSFGLRPSAFVDVGSVWGLKSPSWSTWPRSARRPAPDEQQIPGGSTNLSCTQFNTGGVTAYSRHQFGSRRSRTLCRQFAEAASLRRCRRQLGFAFRAAQDRPREGDPQAGRRRHQTLQLQRRNTILMRKNILMAAIAASMIAVPTAVSAQRLPAHGRCGGRHRQDLQRLHGLRRRPHRSCKARQRLCRPGRRRSTISFGRKVSSSQTAVDALNGKQPDAALQARIKAFQNKEQRRATRAPDGPAASPVDAGQRPPSDQRAPEPDHQPGDDRARRERRDGCRRHAGACGDA